MPIQFQFRRGTAADWTSANTILAAGEMGLETDTNKFKIGNGTLGWTSLPYASGPAGPTGPAGVGTTGPTGSSGITQIVSSWNSTTFYPKGTVIPYDDNNTYIAIQDNTNQDPDVSPAYWSIFVRGGQRGATGAAGTAGDTALNRKVIDDAFLGTSFYFKKTSFSSTVTSTVIPPISLI